MSRKVPGTLSVELSPYCGLLSGVPVQIKHNCLAIAQSGGLPGLAAFANTQSLLPAGFSTLHHTLQERMNNIAVLMACAI